MQKLNPEAFRNIVSRLLEAHGRGMWSPDAAVVDKLKSKYGDADVFIEMGSANHEHNRM